MNFFKFWSIAVLFIVSDCIVWVQSLNSPTCNKAWDQPPLWGSLGAGARFSKGPVTFGGRRQILKSKPVNIFFFNRWFYCMIFKIHYWNFDFEGKHGKPIKQLFFLRKQLHVMIIWLFAECENFKVPCKSSDALYSRDFNILHWHKRGFSVKPVT